AAGRDACRPFEDDDCAGPARDDDLGAEEDLKRIVFIAGSWRSGSTLLGDLLGAAQGLHHVGELHHFWGRGLQMNWRCGCGEKFRSCPFWSRVIGSWGERDPEEARRLDDTRRSLAALGPNATPERISEE